MPTRPGQIQLSLVMTPTPCHPFATHVLAGAEGRALLASFGPGQRFAVAPANGALVALSGARGLRSSSCTAFAKRSVSIRVMRTIFKLGSAAGASGAVQSERKAWLPPCEGGRPSAGVRALGDVGVSVQPLPLLSSVTAVWLMPTEWQLGITSASPWSAGRETESGSRGRRATHSEHRHDATRSTGTSLGAKSDRGEQKAALPPAPPHAQLGLLPSTPLPPQRPRPSRLL